ncbi:MAG: GGDEF domain-containing protein [Proteobacteria bacterium]|nr:GGDEF domain-containing protein [Pseudomonadota bacterium]
MKFQRHSINKRVIADLKKRSTFGIFFYMLVPYCIFLTDNYVDRHPKVTLLSLGIFTAICLFRLVHLSLSGRAAEKYEKLNYKIFFASVVLTALIWGTISTYILVQDGEQKAQFLMIICTSGFGAGGVISFIPERRLSIFYNLFMLLPAATTILVKGDNITLGAALLFYSAYLVLISLRGNSEYWTALENEFLLERQSEELKLASRIDVLTNISNRRRFDELFHLTLGLSARRGTPITLIICDIDHFKTINDTFGHLAGDEYLKCIGRCLQDVFRRETDVVGRYGGDEFVILLPDEGTAAARELAECFRKKVADVVVDYNGAKIASTVSLGMTSCVPQAGQSPETFFKRADTALYMAKNEGRNRIAVHGEC